MCPASRIEPVGRREPQDVRRPVSRINHEVSRRSVRGNRESGYRRHSRYQRSVCPLANPRYDVWSGIRHPQGGAPGERFRCFFESDSGRKGICRDFRRITEGNEIQFRKYIIGQGFGARDASKDKKAKRLGRGRGVQDKGIARFRRKDRCKTPIAKCDPTCRRPD